MLGAAFLGAALVVYEPALSGPFVSDDHHYVRANRYVHALSVENARAVLDPLGDAAIGVVNFAPVQLLIHAAAWEAFGDDVRGHHVVNVVLHALASLLLAVLLGRSGLPPLAAVSGGALFLLHPANVEAVAWISQLKSSAALCLSLAALLAFERRPAAGTALFWLALLAKPAAAFVLPVALLRDRARGERPAWRWYAVAALGFAAYAAVALTLHQRPGTAEAVLYETPLVLLRTALALALRYLVMAASSWGVSTFHEPEPAWSLLDPWWLASLPVLVLLGCRLAQALRRRREEAAWWVWALVSFAPISQIFPFLYPFADRYLYFILPGLIGATLLAGRDLQERVPAAHRPAFLRAAVAGGLALTALFAVRAAERAHVWSSPALILQDAARNYPEGVPAHLLRARRAAQRGDAGAAAEALRGASARGYNRFDQILADPGLAPVMRHPEMLAVVGEIAGGWIDSFGRKRNPTQRELRMLAKAHAARAEYAEAEAVLHRALAKGGREDAAIREDLAALAALR